MIKTSEQLTAEQILSYYKNGYVLLKELFSDAEAQKLKTFADKDIKSSEVMVKADLTGNETKLRMWDRPEDDLYGMFSRNARLVDNVERLLKEEVYIYSSKMILKNAR